jgi:hypothetical protein
VHGQGVEDFVGEDHSPFGPVVRGRGHDVEAGFFGSGEAGGEGLALAGIVFADGVVEGAVEVGVHTVGSPQDIEGQGAVLGTQFEDREGGGTTVCFPGLVESDGEEAAEGLAHAHTGGEIARATDPGAGGIAVVAMLPVVEGQLHEAGKGEWAFLLDEGTQDMVQ